MDQFLREKLAIKYCDQHCIDDAKDKSIALTAFCQGITVANDRYVTCFCRLWDSVTDILSQDQIDKIEQLHQTDIKTLTEI